MDLPHGVRAGEEGRLVPHDLLVRPREPLVEKVVEGEPGKVGEVIVGVLPASPHGPLRPEPEVPGVGDGAGERARRHVSLDLPEVLPVPLLADKSPLPQAQHLRVRAEEPRQPRGSGLPVAHDKEDRRASLQDRPPNPTLPPLAFPPGSVLKLFGPRRAPGRRPCLGFRGEVGAEPAQDLHAFEQVGSGIRTLLGLALLYRETSTKRCPTQRRRAGSLRPYRPAGSARASGRT